MTAATEQDDQLLTVGEVSEMTTLAPGTLYNWRALGKGPRAIRFGSRIVYRRSAVLAWIAEQEQGGESA
jgi:predicted DNA-binding transcriptional regulator AlpA